MTYFTQLSVALGVTGSVYNVDMDHSHPNHHIYERPKGCKCGRAISHRTRLPGCHDLQYESIEVRALGYHYPRVKASIATAARRWSWSTKKFPCWNKLLLLNNGFRIWHNHVLATRPPAYVARGGTWWRLQWKHFRVTGPLCGELTGHRWIPLTKASDAELWYSLWSVPWINVWINNREAGDLRCHCAHDDVIVMASAALSLYMC